MSRSETGPRARPGAPTSPCEPGPWPRRRHLPRIQEDPDLRREFRARRLILCHGDARPPRPSASGAARWCGACPARCREFRQCLPWRPLSSAKALPPRRLGNLASAPVNASSVGWHPVQRRWPFSRKVQIAQLRDRGQEICRLAILKRLRSRQAPVWENIVFGR